MNVPSEAELIEMENRAIQLFDALDRFIVRQHTFPSQLDLRWRCREDFKLLIALARDPSQLLRDIPGDELIDATLDRFGPPPRTSTPKPARTAAAKQKRKK